LPEPTERGYFINFLAAKAQNRDFRGPAVVMIATTEGAGRNTLMIMLSRLFGAQNIQDARLSDLESPANNYYMDSLFVYIDETVAHKDLKQRAKFYETIKSIVDPLTQYVTVNKGNGRSMRVLTVASFFFFSNNLNAIHVPKGTRRVFVCMNPERVGGEKLFKEVHQWMAGDEWPMHVWNWLMSMDVDMATMSGKPPRTLSHEIMQEATQTKLDEVISAAIKVALPHTKLMSISFMNKVIGDHLSDLIPAHANDLIRRNEIKRHTLSLQSMLKQGVFTNIISKDTHIKSTQRLVAIDPEVVGNIRVCEKEKKRYRKFVAQHPPFYYAKLIRAEIDEPQGVANG
jgi:hypothetical protein